MEEMKRMTKRNTKDEILAAYNAARKAIAAQEIESPEEEAVTIEKTQTVQKAIKVHPTDIVNTISDLRKNINTSLQQLENQIVERREQLSTIQSAINIEENKLKERYGIMAEAATLDTIIKAQTDTKVSFDKDMQETREAWKKEQSSHDESIKTRNAQEQLRRNREKEEYEYAQKMIKERDKNEFEYRKQEQKRELALQRNEHLKAMAEKEDAIKAQEEEIAELKARAESFDEVVKQKVEEAVKEATDRAGKSYSFEKRHIEAENKARVEVLETKLESALVAIESLTEEKTILMEKLESSTEKVQSIAAEAVKGAQPKIISMNDKNSDRK